MNSYYNNQSAPQAKSTDSKVSAPSIETSIYKNKGVTVPFGAWAKGVNAAEEECITFFRKVRKGRCRKYTEPEIIGFMQELRGGNKDRKMIEVVENVFDVFENGTVVADGAKAVPDADFVRNALKLTKGRGEREYYGVLEFARHELDVSATRPLEALAKMEPEKQDKLVKIIADINSLDDPFESLHGNGVDTDTMAGLYDGVRHVAYAAEDLPRLSDAEKLSYFSDVYHDTKFFERTCGEKMSETAKNNVLKVSRDIIDAMADVLGL